MTLNSKDFSTPAAACAQPTEAAGQPPQARPVQAILEKLYELYPQLFGAQFLPLKLGVFQELLALHPEHFERDTLKAALGVHTRSTRYLQCVAAGKPRHDLQGHAVEAVAPEHVCAALLELFRRRLQRKHRDARAKDPRPALRAQLVAAFEASGLTGQELLARVHTHDAQARALLEEALAEFDARRARQEALLRAFDASGKTPAEFADMYGLDARDVAAALARRESTRAVPLAGTIPA